LLLLASCRATPDELSPAPDRLPRPQITVQGPDHDRPYSLAAACLPYGETGFEAALARIHLGLRIAGRREDLVIRRASLGEEEARVVMASLGLDDGAFSDRESFGWGDRIIVRSMVRGPPQVGFYLHLVPWFRSDDRVVLDTSAVARPPDGSLLPVLRADVVVDGPGTLLLVGEAGGERAFAVLLDLDVPGVAPGVEAPRSHDLRAAPFAVDSDVLATVLRNAGLPERGDAGGFAAHRVRERDLPALEAALERAGRREAPVGRTVRSGGIVLLGGRTLRIEARSEFSVRDYSYRTRLRLVNRPGARPVWTDHGERDAVLLVAWDADGPGESRAVLIRIRPVDRSTTRR
jgi:hypothetical protein